jgi:N-acetylglutamate synthase-like GNAT family acetyltransferase
MKLLGQVLDLKQADSADGRGLYLANISVVPYASKCGVGARLLDRVIAHARATQATAVMLATFRVPPWNGPWFRRKGFTTMPESEAGAGLLAVLTWHASFLDMQIRGTL